MAGLKWPNFSFLMPISSLRQATLNDQKTLLLASFLLRQPPAPFLRQVHLLAAFFADRLVSF